MPCKAKSTVFRVERVKCNLEQETVYYMNNRNIMPCKAKSTVFRVERVKCNLEQETVYYEQ